MPSYMCCTVARCTTYISANTVKILVTAMQTEFLAIWHKLELVSRQIIINKIFTSMNVPWEIQKSCGTQDNSLCQTVS